MEHEVLSAERRQHTWLDRVRAFVLAEGRGLVASLWQPMWKVGVGVAAPVFLILVYCVVFRRLVMPYDPPVALVLLVALGFSLLYGALAGLVAGLINVGRRLVGNRFFWMLLVIGVSVLMTISLCRDWIDDQGKETIKALSASAASHGFPETAAALDAEQVFTTTRFTRPWPPGKVLAAPFLVTDTIQVLVDGDVLWQYFLYLRIGTIAVLLGLVPSYLFSVVVLWKSGFHRLVERYRKFVADYGVVARY